MLGVAALDLGTTMNRWPLIVTTDCLPDDGSLTVPTPPPPAAAPLLLEAASAAVVVEAVAVLSVPVGVLLLVVDAAAATGQQPLNNNNTETRNYYSADGHNLSWATRSSGKPSHHLMAAAATGMLRISITVASQREREKQMSERWRESDNN